MNLLNSIIVEGNLTADPVITEVDGLLTCEFTIKSSRIYKGINKEEKEDVYYFPIRSFGRLAKSIGQYLVKDRGVRVVGRLFQEQKALTHYPCIFIVSEYIKFKPIVNRESKPEE